MSICFDARPDIRNHGWATMLTPRQQIRSAHMLSGPEREQRHHSRRTRNKQLRSQERRHDDSSLNLPSNGLQVGSINKSDRRKHRHGTATPRGKLHVSGADRYKHRWGSATKFIRERYGTMLSWLGKHAATGVGNDHWDHEGIRVVAAGTSHYQRIASSPFNYCLLLC